jgi:plasmid maintenance system antidote protein VapI
MKTQVYNQGYNRIENYQIISIERAKLNRLLDEERRITQTLAGSLKRQIETALNLSFPDAQMIWNRIRNHALVKNVQKQIDVLTDAYPQFLSQVETMRERLKKKIIESLEIVKFTAQTAAVCC